MLQSLHKQVEWNYILNVNIAVFEMIIFGVFVEAEGPR